MGRPDFQSRGPQIPIFKGFGDLWMEKRCAPKTPNSTTTDLTPTLRARKNQQTRKHKNKILTGLSRDYPGTVPGISRPFPEISWEFCLCVSLSSPEKGIHINNLTPTHFRDNPAKLFMFIGFFFFPDICGPLNLHRSSSLYKKPRQSRPEALLEGFKNFRVSEFSGTFPPPPHTF